MKLLRVIVVVLSLMTFIHTVASDDTTYDFNIKVDNRGEYQEDTVFVFSVSVDVEEDATPPNTDTTFYFKTSADVRVGGLSTEETVYFKVRAEVVELANLTNITVRRGGVDYFIWYGQNDTRATWIVNKHFIGETGYIARWLPDYVYNYTIDGGNYTGNITPDWNGTDDGLNNNNGTNWLVKSGWYKYQLNGSGIDFRVNTYDVIMVDLGGTGTLTISMQNDSGFDYSASRNITLTNQSGAPPGRNYGYNYVGYSGTPKNVEDLVTISTFQWIARWNQTTHVWNIWIKGFPFTQNYTVNLYDVLALKVAQTRYLNIT